MQSERLEKLFSFLEGSPKDPFLLFAVAKEYEALKNDQEALNYYTKLTEDSPDYTGTYYHLGKLLVKLNRVDDAIAIYKTGMTICKQQGDKHAYSELAGAKLEVDDDDEDY